GGNADEVEQAAARNAHHVRRKIGEAERVDEVDGSDHDGLCLIGYDDTAAACRFYDELRRKSVVRTARKRGRWPRSIPAARTTMETLGYMATNLTLIGQRPGEHLSIVSVSVTLAILIGVPIGIAITQSKVWADRVLYGASVIVTTPSIALFGLMIPP